MASSWSAPRSFHSAKVSFTVKGIGLAPGPVIKNLSFGKGSGGSIR